MKHIDINQLFLQTRFRSESSDFPAEFWLVTAYNPNGIDFSDELNRAADFRLFQELDKHGQKPIRITGVSPDELHSEVGWGAIIDETAALKLGRQFQQLAVFHFLPARIDLVDCRDATRITLGARADRILSQEAPI